MALVEAEWTGDPAELFAALAELLERPSWQHHAACRGRTDVNWFPGQGESTEPARAVCSTCPVIAECRAFIEDVAGHYDYGVWAGTSASERRRHL